MKKYILIFGLFLTHFISFCQKEAEQTYKFIIKDFYKFSSNSETDEIVKDLKPNKDNYFLLIDGYDNNGNKESKVILNYVNGSISVNNTYTFLDFKKTKDDEDFLHLEGTCMNSFSQKINFKFFKNKKENFYGFMETSDVSPKKNLGFTGIKEYSGMYDK